MALDCLKLHDVWILEDVGHSFSVWHSLSLHAVGPLDVGFRNTKGPASNVNGAPCSSFELIKNLRQAYRQGHTMELSELCP